eukprot:TRINITY_DN718_c7_g1_i1.p1 TRINITY_DN718_c7_g1~~TRINITY_DN718_c7_g1_i1.p1  ORF type:complete len:413 (+),score=73.88 TRINITY_DN718_c7_g1_i1:104-1240(+)
MTATPTLTESVSLTASESVSVSSSWSLRTATDTFSSTLRTPTATSTPTSSQTLTLTLSISVSETIELEELRWCDFYIGDNFISCDLLALIVAINGALLLLCCVFCCVFCYKRKKIAKEGSFDEMLLSSDKGSSSTEKRDPSQNPPVPREVGNKSPDMGGTFSGSVGNVHQPFQKTPGIVRVHEKGGTNEGDYIISTLSVNSLPTWKRTVPTERWIYSSPDGFWRVTDTTKDFESGKGFVTSSHPHGNEPPNRSEGWFSANGQPLQISMVPEDYKLTPAKQYHSPFPVVDMHPDNTTITPPPHPETEHHAHHQPFSTTKSSALHPSANPMLPPVVPYELPKPPPPVDHTNLYNISNYDNEIYLHDDSDSDEPDGFRRRA